MYVGDRVLGRRASIGESGALITFALSGADVLVRHTTRGIFRFPFLPLCILLIGALPSTSAAASLLAQLLHARLSDLKQCKYMLQSGRHYSSILAQDRRQPFCVVGRRALVFWWGVTGWRFPIPKFGSGVSLGIGMEVVARVLAGFVRAGQVARSVVSSGEAVVIPLLSRCLALDDLPDGRLSCAGSSLRRQAGQKRPGSFDIVILVHPY